MDKMKLMAMHASLAEDEACMAMILAVKGYETKKARTNIITAMANGNSTEKLSLEFLKAQNEELRALIKHAKAEERVVQYEEKLFRRFGIEVSYKKGGLQV